MPAAQVFRNAAADMPKYSLSTRGIAGAVAVGEFVGAASMKENTIACHKINCKDSARRTNSISASRCSISNAYCQESLKSHAREHDPSNILGRVDLWPMPCF